jgi:hypothetical protein
MSMTSMRMLIVAMRRMVTVIHLGLSFFFSDFKGEKAIIFLRT